MCGPEACGVALPNDFGNMSRERDRGMAKLRRCDPRVLQALQSRFGGVQPGQFWRTMNEEGYATVWNKRDKKKTIAGETKSLWTRRYRQGLGGSLLLDKSPTASRGMPWQAP